jgi:signal transduction histidine kinase
MKRKNKKKPGQSNAGNLARFVSDMAHEINNPLMIISGSAEMALMENVERDEVDEALETIAKECERAKEIIRDFLERAKGSSA